MMVFLTGRFIVIKTTPHTHTRVLHRLLFSVSNFAPSHTWVYDHVHNQFYAGSTGRQPRVEVLVGF